MSCVAHHIFHQTLTYMSTCAASFYCIIFYYTSAAANKRNSVLFCSVWCLFKSPTTTDSLPVWSVNLSTSLLLSFLHDYLPLCPLFPALTHWRNRLLLFRYSHHIITSLSEVPGRPALYSRWLGADIDIYYIAIIQSLRRRRRLQCVCDRELTVIAHRHVMWGVLTNTTTCTASSSCVIRTLNGVVVWARLCRVFVKWIWRISTVTTFYHVTLIARTHTSLTHTHTHTHTNH